MRKHPTLPSPHRGGNLTAARLFFNGLANRGNKSAFLVARSNATGNDSLYFRTYTTEIFLYLRICETQNENTHRFHIVGTHLICSQSFRGIVLHSVKLNHNLCTVAIEICDVISNNLLPPKAKRHFSQKIVPQMLFLGCHITPKRLG